MTDLISERCSPPRETSMLSLSSSMPRSPSANCDRYFREKEVDRQSRVEGTEQKGFHSGGMLNLRVIVVWHQPHGAAHAT